MEYLSELLINSFIRLAIAEDVSEQDYSSEACIEINHKSKARLISKDTGILAGISLAERIFLLINKDLKITAHEKDGAAIAPGDLIITVEGSTKAILKAERLILNCMQRMSGIASYTNMLVNMIAHTSCKILDTRKTTPNFRMMEKWAVLIGGGSNHRFNLSDMIMLKDNHIDNAGGIKPAVERVRKYLKDKKLTLKVEVETRNLKEVQEAVETEGIDRIMFDNFDIPMIREALRIVNKKVETEVSGGVTEKSIIELAETGVDFISVGALTHSFRSLDLSLKAEAL